MNRGVWDFDRAWGTINLPNTRRILLPVTRTYWGFRKNEYENSGRRTKPTFSRDEIKGRLLTDLKKIDLPRPFYRCGEFVTVKTDRVFENNSRHCADSATKSPSM